MENLPSIPFLLFPREIRDTIYTHALTTPHPVTAIPHPFKANIFLSLSSPPVVSKPQRRIPSPRTNRHLYL
jgi:hypothetical protein